MQEVSSDWKIKVTLVELPVETKADIARLECYVWTFLFFFLVAKFSCIIGKSRTRRPFFFFFVFLSLCHLKQA